MLSDIVHQHMAEERMRNCENMTGKVYSFTSDGLIVIIRIIFIDFYIMITNIFILDIFWAI